MKATSGGGKTAASVRRRRRKAVPDRGLLRRNRQENRISLVLAVAVVMILLVAVGVNAVSLRRHLKENRAQTEEVLREIQAEEQRAADIEEYRRYTETDAYIEEVAREKLGLIYEGETIFKEEK